MWKQLREIAIIGTGKKRLSENDFPVKVADAISAFADQAPEVQLLSTAALVTYYNQAGSVPTTAEEVDKEMILETCSQAPGEVLEIFNEIEQAELGIQERLFFQWMTLLTQKEWIVESGQILKLIKLTNSSSKEVRDLVGMVIGNKGNWMLTFDSSHAAFDSEKIEDVWQEGTIDQRKKHLEFLLSENPSSAIEALRSTWSSEGISTKKAFLTLLNVTTDPASTEFVQNSYSNEFAWKPSEKKTERECRMICASILLQLPGSQLFKQTTDALRTYFSSPMRFPGMSFVQGTQEVFSLPKQPDKFFCLENMLKVYGIDDKYDIGVFKTDNLYWLGELLVLVPATWWIRNFSQGYQRMASFFLKNDQFETKMDGNYLKIYLESLLQNVVQHKDSKLAAEVYSYLNRDQAKIINPYLAMEVFEKLMINENLLLDHQLLGGSPPGQWSAVFSKRMIESVFKATKEQQYWELQHISATVVSHLSPDCGEFLDKYNEKAKSLNHYKNWQKHFFDPIKTTFKIRKLTESYI